MNSNLCNHFENEERQKGQHDEQAAVFYSPDSGLVELNWCCKRDTDHILRQRITDVWICVDPDLRQVAAEVRHLPKRIEPSVAYCLFRWPKSANECWSLPTRCQ